MKLSVEYEAIVSEIHEALALEFQPPLNAPAPIQEIKALKYALERLREAWKGNAAGVKAQAEPEKESRLRPAERITGQHDSESEDELDACRVNNTKHCETFLIMC